MSEPDDATTDGRLLDRVARALLGEPTDSKQNKERFGDYEIDLDTGLYYDFDEETHGNATALVRKVKGLDNTDAERGIADLVRDNPAFEPPPRDDVKAERDLNGTAHTAANGGAAESGEPKGNRLIKSSAEFTADFEPPDYVVDGILQRRFCYSFTAKTNNGKTAIMLAWAAHVALGRPIGDRGVEPGNVLFLSGENSDDTRARWIAMSEQMDFDGEDIGVHFIAGTFKISEMAARIHAEVEAIGGVALVLVDTSAAYFEEKDENDNVQAGVHARRLRRLTELPGGPCVLVACHPTKNASDDNLQPRGGGAFLAEVDGNLTAKKDDSAVEVHWQGKFRGPDFAPLSFQLRTVMHERLKDSKGRPLTTVVAFHLTDTANEAMTAEMRRQEEDMLKILVDHPNASQAKLATLLDWKMRDGRPYKTLVRRTLTALLKAKLIAKDREGHTLTRAGKKALNAPSSKAA